MITGTHLLIHSTDPEADRTFFREVLQFRSVDAGHGWLIFALPPAEAGIHPAEGDAVRGETKEELASATLYLMCDDLEATISSLQTKKVTCAPITEASWGSTTNIRLPSGTAVGLYQPRHPTAI